MPEPTNIQTLSMNGDIVVYQQQQLSADPQAASSSMNNLSYQQHARASEV